MIKDGAVPKVFARNGNIPIPRLREKIHLNLIFAKKDLK
jgi:hypothetical protein